ncbi:MAG: sce7726 family protein [Lachnospiraceae bacterium]|nr:sce7726 family protein [Lachnospiraceae bacterium]
MLRDKDIREPLFEFLEDNFGKVRIIEEKTMGKARADVLMVKEDGLYGIEIKSDADTYVRLDSQVKYYNQFFRYNFICVGTTHAEHISEHVPDWWGIITVDEVDGKADLYLLRECRENPKMGKTRERRALIKRELQFLWRPELNRVLEYYSKFKYLTKSKKFVQDLILEKAPEEELLKHICQELFERDYTNGIKAIEAYREEKKH